MQKIKTIAPYVISAIGVIGAIIAGYNLYITNQIRAQFGSGVLQILTYPVAIQALQIANQKYLEANPPAPEPTPTPTIKK